MFAILLSGGDDEPAAERPAKRRKSADDDRDIRALRSQASQGDPQAQYDLAVHIETPNTTDAVGLNEIVLGEESRGLLQRAAQQGNKDAIQLLFENTYQTTAEGLEAVSAAMPWALKAKEVGLEGYLQDYLEVERDEGVEEHLEKFDYGKAFALVRLLYELFGREWTMPAIKRLDKWLRDRTYMLSGFESESEPMAKRLTEFFDTFRYVSDDTLDTFWDEVDDIYDYKADLVPEILFKLPQVFRDYAEDRYRHRYSARGRFQLARFLELSRSNGDHERPYGAESRRIMEIQARERTWVGEEARQILVKDDLLRGDIKGARVRAESSFEHEKTRSIFREYLDRELDTLTLSDIQALSDASEGYSELDAAPSALIEFQERARTMLLDPDASPEKKQRAIALLGAMAKAGASLGALQDYYDQNDGGYDVAINTIAFLRGRVPATVYKEALESLAKSFKERLIEGEDDETAYRIIDALWYKVWGVSLPKESIGRNVLRDIISTISRALHRYYEPRFFCELPEALKAEVERTLRELSVDDDEDKAAIAKYDLARLIETKRGNMDWMNPLDPESQELLEDAATLGHEKAIKALIERGVSDRFEETLQYALTLAQSAIDNRYLTKDRAQALFSETVVHINISIGKGKFDDARAKLEMLVAVFGEDGYSDQYARLERTQKYLSAMERAKKASLELERAREQVEASGAPEADSLVENAILELESAWEEVEASGAPEADTLVKICPICMEPCWKGMGDVSMYFQDPLSEEFRPCVKLCGAKPAHVAHRVCFEKYVDHNRTNRRPLTCPQCREPINASSVLR